MAAAEIEPDNPAFTRELARAYAGFGDHLQAMLLLEPLMDGDAADWSCHITYGRAATALKRSDAAVRALRRAAELRPDDPATLKALERALRLAS
jgi:Flp pilus assembly protein TadD